MPEISPGATAASSVPSPKGSITGAFPVLIAAALWMAALRGLHFENFRLGLGLMDGYWASFYLMTYTDGFRRRALIGSLFHLVEPAGAHILLINALAFVVLIALLVIFSVALIRVSTRRSPFSLFLLFAFCVSSLVCVYFEVFGDMLQICWVLFAFIGGVALRQCSTALKLVLSYGLLLLCFSIHEASIFFLAPCLPFLLRRWPRWQDFLAPIAAVVLLLAVSLSWSNLHPHLTYHAILFRHAAPLHLVVETKPFKVLLREMYLVEFGGLMGKFHLVLKFIRIVLLALTGLVAMANLLPWSSLRRQIYVFCAISLFSIPLWIIAEDWGRFLAYNLLLATLVASWDYLLPLNPSRSEAVLPTDALASFLQRFGSYTFVRLAAIMLLVLSPFTASRMLGITSTSIALCLGLIVAAVAQFLGWLPDPLLDSSNGQTR